MEATEKILSLVQRILRGELTLERAKEALLSNQFKPWLSEKVIMELDERANQLILHSPPTAYVLSELSYEASKATDNRNLQATCGFTLGCMLICTSRFRESILRLEQVLRYCERIKGKRAIGSVVCNLGFAYFSLGYYSKAIEYYERALKIAREMEDLGQVGGNLNNLATAYRSSGDYLKAMECAEQALESFQKIGDIPGEILATLGGIHLSLGNYRKALGYYQQALASALAKRQQRTEGVALDGLGLAYISLGQYAKAIDHHQKALMMYKEIGNRNGEGEALHNLGVAYSSLGEYNKAVKHYEEGLKISREVGNRQGERDALGGLAIACWSTGNFSEAIEYSEQALEISQQMGDRAGEGKSLSHLGNISFSLGEYAKVIYYYEQALNISKKIGDRTGEAINLGNLGSAYFSLGHYAQAIESYRKALKTSREIQHTKLEGDTLDNLGLLYFSQGDCSAAVEYHKQALEISRKIADRKGEGEKLDHLGVAYSSKGDYPKAIEYHQKALKISREIGAIELKWASLANLGLVYDRHLGHHDEAYAYYGQSIGVAEKVRARIKQEEHRSSFIGKSEDIYDLMILLCNQMKAQRKERLLESLEYLERSKSRTLLESLAHTPLRPSTGIPAGLIEMENELLYQIKVLYLSKEKQKRVCLTDTERLETELDDVWNRIEKIDPEYVSMRRGRPLSFREIRELVKSLGESVCLVEYFLTQDKLLIFVLRSDDNELQVEEVDVPSQQFSYYFKKYFEELHDFGSENAGQIWQNLSKYLIDPILKYLDGIDTIYFIPHRQLHYLPLHALRHDGEYLIEDYKIAYSPSASVISYCQNKRKAIKTHSNNLILATGKCDDSEDLKRLIRAGATSIAHVLNTQPYLDSQVSIDFLMKNLKGKDIIHFLCHGNFDQVQPMKSGLLLANDERLTVEDIFQLELEASLVTLSACQTGINEQKPGDDLVGLTRSFIYAGTPSVVVSLWSVSARSTIELMEKFYRYLKEGKTKVEALQKAQLDIMNDPKHPEWSHPYYWAPFILVGDWK